MALRTKPTIITNDWASTYSNGVANVYGNVDLLKPSDASIALGDQDAHITGTGPVRSAHNWLLNWLTKGQSYLLQRGIPEWDSTETYPVGALVSYNSVYYRCTTANSNQTPNTYGIYWAYFGIVTREIFIGSGSSGSFVVPKSVSQLDVIMLGGGGGGGGGSRQSSAFGTGGGGGGAARALRATITGGFNPGDTLGIAIGTGGTGGAAATANGNRGSHGGDGGDTVLTNVTQSKTLLTARGGGGGSGGHASSTVYAVGGAPDKQSANQYQIAGFSNVHCVNCYTGVNTSAGYLFQQPGQGGFGGAATDPNGLAGACSLLGGSNLNTTNTVGGFGGNGATSDFPWYYAAGVLTTGHGGETSNTAGGAGSAGTGCGCGGGGGTGNNNAAAGAGGAGSDGMLALIWS